jgi:phosphoribosylglycinamide formyltransferase-1
VLRRVDAPDDRLSAWIDLHFAPSWWSSEVRRGSAWVAEIDGAIAGFAAFGARGLRYPWLRAYRGRPDIGIFGPFGVAEQHRGGGIGEPLLDAALCSLRAAGHARALIPAVGGERLIASYQTRTGATIADAFSDEVPRVRTTILASGAGTNARNVLERVRAGALPLDVSAVVCNHDDAGALDVARAHGVQPLLVVWDRTREARAAYDERLLASVAHTEPELVLLLGWMHLLAPAFLERFAETINLHPAFLPHDPAADEVTAPDGTAIPALRGAHALRDALRAGIAWTGATVHHVTPATDRGDVLVRVPLAIGDAATEEELREKIRPVEFATVATAIRRWTFEREWTTTR